MSDVTSIGKNRVICVRSQDRAFGTPSNFGISLSQYNLNPKYVCWHQISIPNGFFNVNASSHDFIVTVYNATNASFTWTTYITAGNYTSTTLLAALTAQLNADATANAAAPANFFTLAVSNLTGYFTISCVTAGWSFVVWAANSSLDWIVGFRNNSTKGQSATGDVILDLRPVPCIYIRSSLISGNYLSVKGTDSVLAVVQNTSLFTQTIFQRLPQAGIDIFACSNNISMVNFQLVDEFGMELTMDTGQDWEISISLYA